MRFQLNVRKIYGTGVVMLETRQSQIAFPHPKYRNNVQNHIKSQTIEFTYLNTISLHPDIDSTNTRLNSAHTSL